MKIQELQLGLLSPQLYLGINKMDELFLVEDAPEGSLNALALVYSAAVVGYTKHKLLL